MIVQEIYNFDLFYINRHYLDIFCPRGMFLRSIDTRPNSSIRTHLAPICVRILGTLRCELHSTHGVRDDLLRFRFSASLFLPRKSLVNPASWA
jgi:hypothetical protein